MKLADKLRQIKPSATLAVTAKAMELRAQGKEIISLSVGEPDFPTPAHICDAAKKAMDEGFTRYTQVPGIPELRDAVAEYFHLMYGAKASAEATLVSNGAKQILNTLLQTLLNPGEKVLLPTPYWVSYPDMITLAGGVPVYVPAGSDKGFKLTAQDLDAVWTPDTRILILNSPSNPTGIQYSATELDSLAQWALAKDVFIISDEIYDRLVYPPASPVSLACLWEKHPEQIAIVNGLSKSFAMTGWRVGFCLAHPELIKAMSTLQSQFTASICSVAQKAAVAALTGPQEVVEQMNIAFARRRDLAMEIVGAWPDVYCPRPDGAFYIFPDVHARYTKKIPDSTALCTHLLEKAGVAAVPGVAFGDDHCIRFSCALDDATLKKALTRAGAVLQAR